MTNRSASLWAAWSLATAIWSPLALAAVGDEFVCDVGYRDANDVKLLGTQVNLAVIREPVSRAPGYDFSTSGSASIHSGAPQAELHVSLALDYQHDLELASDHTLARAQQLTCLSGSVTRAGVTETVRSKGCDAAPNEVSIVQNVPAFDANHELTARLVNNHGSLKIACHHLRSIIR